MAGKSSGMSMPTVKLDIKMVLALTICLALSVGTYMLFTKPQRSQASEVAAQVVTAEAVLEHNTQRIHAITNGETNQVDEDLVKAQTLDLRLPMLVDRVSMAAVLPSLAAQHAVVVDKMDPMEDAASSGALKSQKFDMAVHGTPDAITSFVRELQNYSSVLTVSGFALSETGTGEATASFKTSAYYVESPLLGMSR